MQCLKSHEVDTTKLRHFQSCFLLENLGRLPAPNLEVVLSDLRKAAVPKDPERPWRRCPQWGTPRGRRPRTLELADLMLVNSASDRLPHRFRHTLCSHSRASWIRFDIPPRPGAQDAAAHEFWKRQIALHSLASRFPAHLGPGCWWALVPCLPLGGCWLPARHRPCLLLNSRRA